VISFSLAIIHKSEMKTTTIFHRIMTDRFDGAEYDSTNGEKQRVADGLS